MTPDEAYGVLDASSSTPAEELRSRYRRLMIAAHPDHGGTRERLEEVRAAYETVRDLAGSIRKYCVGRVDRARGSVVVSIPQEYVDDAAIDLHCRCRGEYAELVIPRGARLPYQTTATFDGHDEPVLVLNGRPDKWWVGGIEMAAEFRRHA